MKTNPKEWNERAHSLARQIPGRDHPGYRQAVHHWAYALQRAIYTDQSTMNFSDYLTMKSFTARFVPVVPTTVPDYSGQKDCNDRFEERLLQIERRLENLEILVRLQEDDLK